MKRKFLPLLLAAPLLLGLAGCSTFNVGSPQDTIPTMDAKTKQQLNDAASKAAEKAGEAARKITDTAKNWNASDTDKVVAELKKLGKSVTDIKVTHETEGGKKVSVVTYKLNGKTHQLHLRDSDFSLDNLLP